MERKLWGEELAQQGILFCPSRLDHVTVTFCSCDCHDLFMELSRSFQIFVRYLSCDFAFIPSDYHFFVI